MRRLALTAAFAALLAGAVLAYAEISARSGPVVHHSNQLKIRGHVNGLYPGKRKPLRVRVHNGTDKTVVMRSLHIKVSAAGHGCAKSNLKASTLKRPRMVPPSRTRKIGIPVTMPASAPDACQGAQFPLRYHGRFTRAR